MRWRFLAILAVGVLAWGPGRAQPAAPAAAPPPAPAIPAAPAAPPAPAAPLAPVAPAAEARSGDTPAPIDPEMHAAAAAVTDMVGVAHQSDQLIALLRNQIISLVMRAGNKSPAEAAVIVDEVLMPDFRKNEPELTNQLVDAWARNFTLDDLKGLQVFYATPLGQKLIRTLPVVNQQGLQAGQAWGERVYQESITAHKDELILRGLKF